MSLGVLKRVAPLAALTGLLALAVAGCGGGGSPADAELAQGARLFKDANCGACHTLADANASGTQGPNLDAAAPDLERVKRQVTNGGNGMPAFSDRFSEEQITTLARYVSNVASGSLDALTAFKPDDTELSDCKANDQLCYEQAFANLTFNEGPGPAIGFLDRQIRSDRRIATACHRIGHAMGAAAIERFDGDTSKAISEASAICSSGIYHGILEHSFAGLSDDELGGTAAEICTGGALEGNPFLTFQCNHGMGHGLMITTGYDLPVALDTCEEIGNETNVTACQDGVFMENFTSSYDYTSEWIDDEDLTYPCNDVAEDRKYSCYIIVTARILPEVNWNWRKAAEVCRTAEANWQYVCFRSYGRDAISTNAYDQDTARRLCTLTGDMEGECILSVGLHIANEDGNLKNAGRFCQETPSEWRVHCYAGLGSTAVVLIPDPRKLQEQCKGLTADPREQIACSTGEFPPA